MRPASLARFCAAAFALAAASSATLAAAPDLAQGKKLYEQHCTACHVRLLGSDGTSIHTRKNSIIHSLSALQQRVAFCSTQIDAHLFPEEEADIAAWLNEKFYKFK